MRRPAPRKTLSVYSRFTIATLSDNQFGFRSGLNKTNALLDFLSAAQNSLNDRSHMLVLYLDFSKAFDPVNHEI